LLPTQTTEEVRVCVHVCVCESLHRIATRCSFSAISLIHTVFVPAPTPKTTNTHTHNKHPHPPISLPPPPLHTHPGRALTFILSLTDDVWREEWGGALWWLNSEPTSFIPRFNSLILFIPSIRTFHMVTPVIGGGEDVHEDQPHAKYRRLAVSGWFYAVERKAFSERQSATVHPLPSTVFEVSGEGAGRWRGRGSGGGKEEWAA
jgi:hypothetical protein